MSYDDYTGEHWTDCGTCGRRRWIDKFDELGPLCNDCHQSDEDEDDEIGLVYGGLIALGALFVWVLVLGYSDAIARWVAE